MLHRRLAHCVANATMVSVLFLAAPSDAKPIAVVEESIKDFKVVLKGDVIHHRFAIRNDGDEPLTIGDVRPTCGCTVANVDKLIAPGSTGYLEADLDTATLEVDGQIEMAITVYTNDLDNEEIQLLVRADVQPVIGVDPGYARFVHVQGGESNVSVQTVYSPDGSDLVIVDATSAHDHLAVRFRPAREDELAVERPGQPWRVEIELLPGAPIGALRDFVDLVLEHPQQKQVRIPVSGFVRAKTSATPQR